MRLTQLLDKIKQIHPENLPGYAAQTKMSPPSRRKFEEIDLKNLKAKESAVMLFLYEKKEEVYLVFTQRHEYKGAHSGQISFPGGKKDPEDESILYTAVRETHEEIGIVVPVENVINSLTWLYVPPSNFVIYPFIAFYEGEPKFEKEEKEVKEILEFRLKDLIDERNQKEYIYENNALKIKFSSPSYQISQKVIWGATAMILSEFLSIIET